MLGFREYGDFSDYFGLRWHYYLGAIIATIPVPFIFERDQFKNGLATKVLSDFAADPFPYLDEAGKKMKMVQSDLRRKFTDLALDEAAEVRWRVSQRSEADNIESEPPKGMESQNLLFEPLDAPF